MLKIRIYRIRKKERVRQVRKKCKEYRGVRFGRNPE